MKFNRVLALLALAMAVVALAGALLYIPPSGEYATGEVPGLYEAQPTPQAGARVIRDLHVTEQLVAPNMVGDTTMSGTLTTTESIVANAVVIGGGTLGTTSVQSVTVEVSDTVVAVFGTNSGNVAFGTGTASAGYSHAEGYNTTASGDYSHAEGASTTASGDYSHAEGYQTVASAWASHAEGRSTTASGDYSHAEGYLTTASGDYSHAEGRSTTASGDYSHAEGYLTTASSFYGHAEGYLTTASGYAGHAEGRSSTASGYASHAGGSYAVAGDYAQWSRGGGRFAADGDAQMGVWVAREQLTMSNAWVALYLDGTDDEISIASDTVMTLDILIVGTESGATESFGYQVHAVVENDGGTTTILAQTVTALYEDDVSYNVQVAADDVNDTVEIQVTDADNDGDVVRWVATVRGVQVSYP